MVVLHMAVVKAISSSVPTAQATTHQYLTLHSTILTTTKLINTRKAAFPLSNDSTIFLLNEIAQYMDTISQLLHGPICTQGYVASPFITYASRVGIRTHSYAYFQQITSLISGIYSFLYIRNALF